MKIYQLNNDLLRVENNELFIYNNLAREWNHLSEIPIEPKHSKFSYANVNFENKSFINKDNEKVFFDSGPLYKIEWIRWFRIQTDCCLKDAKDISERFCKVWPSRNHERIETQENEYEIRRTNNK